LEHTARLIFVRFDAKINIEINRSINAFSLTISLVNNAVFSALFVLCAKTILCSLYKNYFSQTNFQILEEIHPAMYVNDEN